MIELWQYRNLAARGHHGDNDGQLLSADRRCRKFDPAVSCFFQKTSNFK